MKFTTSAVLISAVFTTLVSAETIVSITSPLSGTKLKAGSDAIISWVNHKVPTISQIVLARGPSTALQPLMVIAKNVNAADGRYVWSIPYEIQNGEEYAFELGTSPDLAFAGPFTIEGGTGGTLPSSKDDPKSGASQPAPQSPPSNANTPASTPASTTPSNANANTNSGSAANPAGGSASPAGSHSSPHASGAAPLSFTPAASTLALVGLGSVVAIMQLL